MRSGVDTWKAGGWRRFVLLLGLLLILVGAILLIVCGSVFTRNWVQDGYTVPTECRVESVILSDYEDYASTYVKCRCLQGDGECARGDNEGWDRGVCEGGLCYSFFPCLQVEVSYSTDGGATRTNATLYRDGYWKRYRSQTPGSKCFQMPCDFDVSNNEEQIWKDSIDFLSGKKQDITCFYDPDSPDAVISWRVRKWEVGVSMGISSGVTVLGLILVLCALCCPDKEQDFAAKPI